MARRGLALVSFAGHRDRDHVVEAARDHVGDGGGEHVVAVEVEQLDGAGDADREAAAGERPAFEQPVDAGRDDAEPVAAPDQFTATYSAARAKSMSSEMHKSPVNRPSRALLTRRTRRDTLRAENLVTGAQWPSW